MITPVAAGTSGAEAKWRVRSRIWDELEAREHVGVLLGHGRRPQPVQLHRLRLQWLQHGVRLHGPHQQIVQLAVLDGSAFVGVDRREHCGDGLPGRVESELAHTLDELEHGDAAMPVVIALLEDVHDTKQICIKF